MLRELLDLLRTRSEIIRVFLGTPKRNFRMPVIVRYGQGIERHKAVHLRKLQQLLMMLVLPLTPLPSTFAAAEVDQDPLSWCKGDVGVYHLGQQSDMCIGNISTWIKATLKQIATFGKRKRCIVLCFPEIFICR